MATLAPEFEELRIHVERLRALLETLVVRGLRACGPDELTQLQSHAEHLERAGAGHVAAVLGDLHAKIETDDRASAPALLKAQIAVRLLDRLLTLRVVRGQFQAAVEVVAKTDIAGATDDE